MQRAAPSSGPLLLAAAPETNPGRKDGGAMTQPPPQENDLTCREVEVVRLLTAGCRNQDIARQPSAQGWVEAAAWTQGDFGTAGRSPVVSPQYPRPRRWPGRPSPQGAACLAHELAARGRAGPLPGGLDSVPGDVLVVSDDGHALHHHLRYEDAQRTPAAGRSSRGRPASAPGRRRGASLRAAGQRGLAAQPAARPS